jgi:nitric oxide reductase NorD protein
MRPYLTEAEIAGLLDEWLETEFSFIRIEALAAQLARLGRTAQPFVLELVRRVAATNIELAHQFALRSEQALGLMEPAMIRDWTHLAMDRYDSAGLAPALAVIRDPAAFVASAREREFGAYLEDCQNVLRSFLRGLSGRRLQIEYDELAWTDGETIFLPRVVARLEDQEQNFLLYKAMATHLWAQTRFGSFRPDLAQVFAPFDDPARAHFLYHHFERLRLDACLARELPGLHRRMLQLRHWLGDAEADCPPQLAEPSATAFDSLAAVARFYQGLEVQAVCYQGVFRPELIEARKRERIEREKVMIRVRLAEVLDQLEQEGRPRRNDDRFELRRTRTEQGTELGPEELPKEILLDGKPLPPPDDVAAMMSSVLLDLGELPEDYLHPAGEGEYDLSQYRKDPSSVDEVWSGTYHEEGASLYNEWDFRRQHYRKNWCVVREHSIDPGDTDFYRQTLARYRYIVGHLRRTFEVLRGEDRLLKRQPYGEGIDIDALVDGWADMRSGLELSDRLFTRLHREERNIAVMLMVDLSGSTKGWINQAERESLILLAEALEILGDRYAIYGFSGWGRKRCEVFKVKGFDEPLSDEVKGRICAVEARDYTRMGPAIRHLSGLLNQVEARVKLLVTLSDGKPDDYDLEYRGDYGIEDTRMALYEAHRQGVHAYCITIDKTGKDYLAHMYGKANFAVIDEVSRLPLKVSDIYRKITS